ncbi:phage tail protein [Janthinobacterium aestuarii]
MSTYFAILTQVGEAKLANAIALGQTLKLKKMGVGDGNGALPTPDRMQKALVRETRRADLNQLAIDPANASQIIVEQVLPENVGGWWIREIGIYDEAGDLCAVANCPPSYKPVMAEGSARTQVVRVVLIVASTAAIELKIDPAVILATRKYADDQIIEVRAYADALLAQHLAAPDPHPQYRPKELIVLNKSVAGKVDVVLTEAEAKADVLTFTGALTGNINVIVPAAARSWTVCNKTTGAFSLTLKPMDGAGVGIGRGQTQALYCDGTTVLPCLTETSTPLQFDASTGLANMAAVQRALGNRSGVRTLSASYAIAAADIGKVLFVQGAEVATLTLPSLAGIPGGATLEIVSQSLLPVIVRGQAGQVIVASNANNALSSLELNDGDSLVLVKISDGAWLALAGTAQLKYASAFVASLTSNGHQRLPSGLLLQWGYMTTSNTGPSVFAFPTAFPAVCLAAWGTGSVPGGEIANVGVAGPSRFNCSVSLRDAAGNFYINPVCILAIGR